MTNHKTIFSHTIANGERMKAATANSSPELVSAFSDIVPVGSRPHGRVARRLMDASRGRPCNPLGVFPEDAKTVALSGKSTAERIKRPLFILAAQIDGWCGKPIGSLMDCLRNARKESSEADVSELNLALSCANPDTSVLRAADKELREAIAADEALAECIERKLYAGRAS